MKAQWTAPTTYTDGTPFGRNDLAGFEIQLDSTPAISVPFAWNDAGKYEFLIDSLQPAPGKHVARVLTVAANGAKSEWSADVEFTYKRAPRSPLGLSVSS